MLKRLVAFLLGHLRIEIAGGRVETFLNLALEEGLYLWNIEHLHDRMRASITISDFFGLRPVARGARARVRIRRRTGFPFLLQRLKRRPVWIAGAAACLAFVYWATGHIWVIDVKITPPQNLDPRAVRAVAAEAGLKPGVWSGRVDYGKVQLHLQERIGDVSWAIVRVKGTRAEIEIVEKAVKARQPKDQAACINLVARKNAVVEQVVPFQGEPMVKKGDIVKAGDLLVECSFKYWEGGRPMVYPGTPLPDRESVARTVVAQGIIRGRVNYQRYLEIPLVQEIAEPTGRTAVQWVLKWKDRSIILRGGQSFPAVDGVPFARYEERRQTYSFGSWRNWKSPVELVIVHASEVAVRKERIPVAKAQELAKEQMAAQLRWILGPSDKVVTPLQAEVTEQKEQYVGIRVSVETLEEIALPREGAPVPIPQPLPDDAKQTRP